MYTASKYSAAGREVHLNRSSFQSSPMFMSAISSTSGSDGFLRRVHGVTFCNKVCDGEIPKALNVDSLLRMERFQLCCFSHVSRVFHESLLRQVLLAAPMRKRPRGRSSTRWSNYITDLAWSRLSVEPAEPHEIAIKP